MKPQKKIKNDITTEQVVELGFKERAISFIKGNSFRN